MSHPPHRAPESLPPALAAWRDGGRWLEVFGLRIYTRTAGPADGPPLLVLHGFPTHSYDFHKVLPELAERHRVVVHDHPGFGLSDKPERWSYSLVDQAEVALVVWRELGIRRGHLLAHDYGTSVATELLARRERRLSPVDFDSVTLCNGSVHLRLAKLKLSQRLLRNRVTGPRFARLVTRSFFDRRIRSLFAEPGSVPDAEMAALWAGVARAGGVLRAPAVSSYLGDRLRFEQRWVPPLERLDLPAHVVWGRHDPVAVPAIAERLAAEIPGARLTWLEEAGHYPMLETPAAFARAVLGFLGSTEGPRGPEGAC